MLQIISGKFFKSNNLIKYDGRGVLYSNYSWPVRIETRVATLEPVDVYFPLIATYIVNYVNQIEREPDGRDVIVRTGDEVIVAQFKLICTFGLQAFFDIDRFSVESNCRTYSRSSHDKYVPSRFVPRFFNDQLRGNKEEAEAFVELIDKIIGLRRDRYLGVINSLNAFYHSLQILNFNIDLAYTLLVYSLESLSQRFTDFTPSWSDYDESVRLKLDNCLSDASIRGQVAENIRQILIADSSLRVKKRFVDFSITNVTDSFFIEEVSDIENPIRKSELEPLLINAYETRSKYVHELKPILEQLTLPEIARSEVFHWENKPYFTFRGLLRLVIHIITNFIYTEPVVEKEDINWRMALPSVMEMELAPAFWVGAVKGFKPDLIRERLSGFLVMLSNQEMPNLRGLMGEIELCLKRSEPKYKLPMVAMYTLYNVLAIPDLKTPNCENIIEEYDDVFADCSVEGMITYLILEQNWPWSVGECSSIFNEYCKKKFGKGRLRLPQSFEVSIILEISNMYLDKEDLEEYDNWSNIAIRELPGKKEYQDMVTARNESRERFVLDRLLRPKNGKQNI